MLPRARQISCSLRAASVKVGRRVQSEGPLWARHVFLAWSIIVSSGTDYVFACAVSLCSRELRVGLLHTVARDICVSDTSGLMTEGCNSLASRAGFGTAGHVGGPSMSMVDVSERVECRSRRW
jgi:hypothetical protein